MAATYTWPPSLPTSPQKGYSETGGVTVLRTPADAGPAKVRFRGKKPQILNVTYIMTTAQVDILETFIKDTIKGVSRFNYTHPRTGATIETRVISQGGGDIYTLSYLAPGYYNVSLQLEILI